MCCREINWALFMEDPGHANGYVFVGHTLRYLFGIAQMILPVFAKLNLDQVPEAIVIQHNKSIK